MWKRPWYGRDIILNLYVVARIYRHLAISATSLLKGRIPCQLVREPSFWESRKNNTGVIYDPLGQAHSLASSEHCFDFVLFY